MEKTIITYWMCNLFNIYWIVYCILTKVVYITVLISCRYHFSIDHTWLFVNWCGRMRIETVFRVTFTQFFAVILIHSIDFLRFVNVYLYSTSCSARLSRHATCIKGTAKVFFDFVKFRQSLYAIFPDENFNPLKTAEWWKWKVVGKLCVDFDRKGAEFWSILITRAA
jgi:hypothetical protein